jgi:hypothetical protein
MLGHAGTANAVAALIRPALTHAPQQQTGQQIARSFARHQGKPLAGWHAVSADDAALR